MKVPVGGDTASVSKKLDEAPAGASRDDMHAGKETYEALLAAGFPGKAIVYNLAFAQTRICEGRRPEATPMRLLRFARKYGAIKGRGPSGIRASGGTAATPATW